MTRYRISGDVRMLACLLAGTAVRELMSDDERRKHTGCDTMAVRVGQFVNSIEYLVSRTSDHGEILRCLRGQAELLGAQATSSPDGMHLYFPRCMREIRVIE